jgi:hypothetical protein
VDVHGQMYAPSVTTLNKLSTHVGEDPPRWMDGGLRSMAVDRHSIGYQVLHKRPYYDPFCLSNYNNIFCNECFDLGNQN